MRSSHQNNFNNFCEFDKLVNNSKPALVLKLGDTSSIETQINNMHQKQQSLILEDVADFLCGQESSRLVLVIFRTANFGFDIFLSFTKNDGQYFAGCVINVDASVPSATSPLDVEYVEYMVFKITNHYILKCFIHCNVILFDFLTNCNRFTAFVTKFINVFRK